MKLLKAKWVSHSGNPIFCVDIHPDGSRFATGGQVDDTGRISIWNMAPVVDAKDEEDENVPKMLCLLDNHSGCVNCLRWSNSGRYLASGADDKCIMIWQLGRGFGSSTVFGSGGTIVNIEHWRCVHSLRGHTGDILDIAWSPDDRYLASGSVDNTVIIWNAEKFPGLIMTLKGHQGLVKGVTWDPVGKYFASQSDDKTLKIWRISDWKLEATVSDPFEECGGTTHVLRLNWSPDGQYVVSSHAMNNGGPVAKIIERDGWKARMDFVGHRRAITSVRFNSRLLTRLTPNDPSKFKQYACCAIGSRDRSLSIWLTSLKRPLVVIHDLFQSSIMDMSWSRCGYRLMACSLDGTLAYLEFTVAELGKSMTDQEKLSYHKQTYGTSIVSSKTNFAQSIIENPEILKVHQQQQQQERARKALLSQQLSSPTCIKKGIKSPSQITSMITDVQHLSRSGGFTSGSSDNKEAAMMVLQQQKETLTKDGRRRIKPLMIAPPLDLSDTEMAPFPEVNSSVQSFKLSEAENTMAERVLLQQPRSQSDKDLSSPTPSIKTQSSTQVTPTKKPQEATTTTTAKTNVVATQNVTAKRKTESPLQTTLGKRGRKEKDKNRDKQSKDDGFSVVTRGEEKDADSIAGVSARFENACLLIQHPKVEKHLTLKVQDTETRQDGDETVFEVDNLSFGSSIQGVLNVLRCSKNEAQKWEAYLVSPGIALACSQFFVCVACQNKSLHVFSRQGRRIMPTITLSSHIAILQCSNAHLFVVTSSGYVNVWNVRKQEATISRESLHHLLKGTSLNRTFITDTGVPVVVLTDSTSYAFSPALHAWTQVGDSEDPLRWSSSYHGFVPGKKPTGMLSSVQSFSERVTKQTSQDLRMSSSKQQNCTINHLENQLCSALVLGSSEEYRFWLMTYVRYLVQSGEEFRLRELCEDLLGPCTRKSDVLKDNSWQPKILVFRKRDLLQDILPIIGSNLRFQRYYTEFKEQLEYANRR